MSEDARKNLDVIAGLTGVHPYQVKAIRDALDCADQMQEVLERIYNWSRAYPQAVFPEPTSKQWGEAQAALRSIGLCVDIFIAENMRHALKVVGRIAREGLGRKP